MTTGKRAWLRYVASLRKVNDIAAGKFLAFMNTHPNATNDQLIEAAFALATKYGEAAAELACQMYDATAAASGMLLEPAVPAATATMDEVARAVVGTAKTGSSEITSGAVGRLVKMAGVDTTMQNAVRDGAEWAWIPQGGTCAFCIALASRGWQPASRAQMKGNHAEHIHANCDCTFQIRFNDTDTVEGYDPERYREIYDDAEGRSSAAKINSMRREAYADTKDRLERRGVSEAEKRIVLNSSAAEEIVV